MSLIELNRAKQYANEQLTALIPVLPTKAVTFDNGIYSVPSDIVNGQVSDVKIKGVTRTNLVKSSNLDTDTNADGVVDDFTKLVGTGITATHTFDLTEKAQKIEITASTTPNGAWIQQVIEGINPGDVISASFLTKLGNANVRSRVFWDWLDISNNVISSTTSSAYSSPTTYAEIKLENQVAPANTSKLKLYILVAPTVAGNIGVAWFKNALVEKATTIRNYISTGIKSTFPAGGRVKSVGKNLFDGQLEIGTISTTTGLNAASTTKIRSKNYIPVKQNSQIVLSGTNVSSSNYIYEYDINKNFIRSVDLLGGYSKTLSLNTQYIKFIQELNAVNLQIEFGSTATTYEPYKESTIQIPEVGRSLPNGTKDEVNVTLGQKIQKSNQYILQASDIIALYKEYTNVDIVTIRKPLDCINPTTPSSGQVSLGSYSEFTSNTGVDNVTNAGKYYFNLAFSNDMELIVSKGTYADIAAAQAALAGLALTYQLATPITTKIPAQPPLQVFEGGTVYVEPIGDLTETTLPSITANLPIGDNNKFGVAVHDYQAANADWVLTTNEQKCMILVASNSGANANIILPNVAGRVYMVKNATAYNVVCKSAGAEAGTTILPGNSGIVFNGGV